jgi:uncharacterized protein GlcG (DUF336 family)
LIRPPLTVAALDAGGHPLVIYRQTGSGIVRPQIAGGKAWGALGLGFGSRGIANATERFPGFFEAPRPVNRWRAWIRKVMMPT